MPVCPHCREDHPEGTTYCPHTGLSLGGGDRALKIGEVLDGKYRIVRELAAGAMGVVYVAQHTTLGRMVAVKTLRRELLNDADLMKRFEQEARAASAIGHPNIVDVFDLGHTRDGSSYMVMELLEGRPLSAIMDVEPLMGVPQAVDVITQALGALAAAHKNGIVHRDLKPENIFVVETEDRPSFVKLLDFGISKVLAQADPAMGGQTPRGTAYGTVMGTPEYMSPEQARGLIAEIDARTDLYATGVVLYEMLCGRTPFQGDNYNAIMTAIILGEYPRPRELRGTLPAELEHVIMKAMAYQRDQRYASATAMREPLVEILRKVGGRPASDSVATRPSGSAARPVVSATLLSTHVPGQTVSLPRPEDVPSLDLDLAASTPSMPTLAGPAPMPPMQTLTSGLAAATATEVDEADMPMTLSLVSLDGVEDPPPAIASPAPAPAPAPARAPVPVPAPATSAMGNAEPILALVEPLAPKPILMNADAARPIRRPQSRTLAEPQSGLAQKVAGWIGIALVVALGGGVAYRYLKYGYLIHPSDGNVKLAVSPDAAQVQVDGAPASGRTLALTVGKPHTFQVSAPGYVARHTTIVVRGGDQEIALRLGHALLPAGARDLFSPASPVPRREGAAAADIDAAIAKIDLYRDCLDRGAEELHKSHERFAAPPPHGRRHGELQLVSDDLLQACATSLKHAAATPPGIAALDAAGTAEAAALLALAPLVHTTLLDEDDKRAKELGAAFAQFAAADEELRSQLRLQRAGYELAELSALGEEAEHAGWLMRRFVLETEAWVRARQTRGGDELLLESRRARAAKAYDEILQRANAEPEEIGVIVNVQPFLEAAAAVDKILVSSAHGHAGMDAGMLTAVNKMIAAFDGLIVVD